MSTERKPIRCGQCSKGYLISNLRVRKRTTASGVSVRCLYIDSCCSKCRRVTISSEQADKNAKWLAEALDALPCQTRGGNCGQCSTTKDRGIPASFDRVISHQFLPRQPTLFTRIRRALFPMRDA